MVIIGGVDLSGPCEHPLATQQTAHTTSSFLVKVPPVVAGLPIIMDQGARVVPSLDGLVPLPLRLSAISGGPCPERPRRSKPFGHLRSATARARSGQRDFPPTPG